MAGMNGYQLQTGNDEICIESVEL